MKKGKIIIISGPSGVGKGTICSQLLKNKKLNLISSISMTTRNKRNNEKEGVNYFFVNEAEFIKNINNNSFLEYAKFVNNYYGTPKAYCEAELSKGNNVLLEIEAQGAAQVIKNCKNIISIFILPPSIDELKKRITNRRTETIEIINKRIDKAKSEMKLASNYMYNVINDKLEKTVFDIENILTKEINYA